MYDTPLAKISENGNMESPQRNKITVTSWVKVGNQMIDNFNAFETAL